MSYGEQLSTARDEATSRPAFELALRGYDKRQVDHFLARKDREIANLAAERDRIRAQAHEIASRLEQVQAELTELRHRPNQLERASFRDLGPTVDQILALAEKQAQEITDAASRRAAQQQTDAELLLAEAHQRADRLRADGEATHEQALQEAHRVNEQSAQQLEDARSEAEAMLESARTQARQELDAARAQTQQEIQTREEALTQLHAELDAAAQQLTRTRQEAAAGEQDVARLQQRLGEVSEELTTELNRLDEAKRAAGSAERHAKDVRARVQREAERVAQLAAAAVMAAAARGAETGEYPMVMPAQVANGIAAAAVEAQGDPLDSPHDDLAPYPASGVPAAGFPSGYEAEPSLPAQNGPPPPETAEAPTEAR